MTAPLGRVGLLHPGSMGVTIGSALVATGHDVHWSGTGRSDASHQRATNAGLIDAGTLADLASTVDTIVSVCPPDAALVVAQSISEVGMPARYLDANAIAPDTAHRIAALVRADGGTYIDGGIIGPPASRSGTTRLYVSGDDADLVVDAFDGSLVEAIATGGGEGAASALKLVYAGWTKGSSALLLTMRAAAESAGVADALISEWERSQPGLVERTERTAAGAAPKAWRWVGEMEEIAAFLEAAEMPNGFFEAAAEVYDRLEESKDRFDPPLSLDEVMRQLRDGGTSGPPRSAP